MVRSLLTRKRYDMVGDQSSRGFLQDFTVRNGLIWPCSTKPAKLDSHVPGSNCIISTVWCSWFTLSPLLSRIKSTHPGSHWCFQFFGFAWRTKLCRQPQGRKLIILVGYLPSNLVSCCQRKEIRNREKPSRSLLLQCLMQQVGPWLWSYLSLSSRRLRFRHCR